MLAQQVLPTVLVLLHYCTAAVLLPHCNGGTTYVVAENTTDCLPADGECHPLSFYVAHSSSYFADNTIFYFKEGTHTSTSDINLLKISNICFIGSSNNVLINGVITINSSINVSIVNITMPLSSLILIDNSFGVSMYNVNAGELYSQESQSIYMYINNGFDMVVANSSIAYILVKFSGKTNCDSSLQNYTWKVIDSTLGNIQMNVYHGTSYYVNMTMDNVEVIGDVIYVSNIEILLGDSLYLININNVSSYNGCEGLLINFKNSKDTTCQFSNSQATRSLIVTNSRFFNGLPFCRGLGFGIYVSSGFITPTVVFIKSCFIYDNAGVGLLMYRIAQLVNFKFCIILKDVHITNSSSTGLLLINTQLILNGSLSLVYNRGYDGAGMQLLDGSYLEIYQNSSLVFTGNNATNKGGGLYSDSYYYYVCPFRVQQPNNYLDIKFINNRARVGDDVYGTDLSKCSLTSDTDIKQTTVPVTICFCTSNSYGGCTDYMETQHIFPGQKIYFYVALWGVGYITNYSITEGTISLYLNNKYSQEQTITSNCSLSSYLPNDFKILPSTYNLTLTKSFFGIVKLAHLTILFSVIPCPIGFDISPQGLCTCSSSIAVENVTCNIETLQISHKGQLWIGPYNTSITFNADQPNHHNICLINEQCLLCNPSTFMLNDTHLQCQQHKSGTLCGSCTTGYSIVLGSNECKECTTNYNIALTILFAFMGIALVALLIILNLTVSVGTINGLLFTANIIKLYQPVFLGNQIPIPFFNQIISWLNLDFGIKVCFYNGMDRYVKEWLQFVFPFYVWGIIIVIILICRVSSKVSKLVGTNAVPVLATLLLLSYTKLLCTIVAVLHKRDITLHCQNSSHQLTVWYEDPTLQYAKGKHLYLFSFALIVLVLFCLPYTLFLLLNPLFEKYLSKYRLCNFWYKIKPVLDAYSGPMKDEYRFWPGLLLVARIPVLLAVLLVNNVIQFHSLLLSILLSVIVVIWSLTYCFQRVYNNRLHNFIETWFIFMLTAMVVLVMASDNVLYTAIWYNVNIGVFTFSFFGVIVYHIHLKLNKKNWYISCTNKIKPLFEFRKEEIKYEEITQIRNLNDNVFVAELDFPRDESVIELFD